MTHEPDPKSSCRTEMKNRLRTLDVRTRRDSAIDLRDRVLSRVRADRIATVMAFLSDDLEIDLDPTIEALLADGVDVGVPVVQAERGGMIVARLPSLESGALDHDRYGLRQPRPPLVRIAPESLELVLVPGLAFSREGHRLGRGGGYYDRFLAALPSGVRRIGVGFGIQMLDDLPVEAHDAGMDEVITIQADSGDRRFST